jgi:hypothetical protein
MGGVAVALLGVLVIVQVVGGDALGRLNVLSKIANTA